jgi:hypothetical protein
MAPAIGSAEMCALERPASRRFYVHIGSLGFLVAVQPTFFDEVAHALALSAASRALDQVVEDYSMFSPNGWEPLLALAGQAIHKLAADALQDAFQCVVQLIPPRFGSTELLLGSHEKINAWCYEDGYLTYATDELAAKIMYSEAGSLRELRSEIRRSPSLDPALEMISGQSLFLYDGHERTGPGTARFYKTSSARLLRSFRRDSLPSEFDDTRLVTDLGQHVDESARTFEGDPVIESCRRRAKLMITTLMQNLPAGSTATVA